MQQEERKRLEKTVAAKVAPAICTGCAACANVCPADAIAMRPDAEGFLMPAVNTDACTGCGKCAAVCPALHPVHSNDPAPACFAFRAADAVRRFSSSGGAFPLLARQMLARGGHVCGAIFAENCQVVHALANSLEGVAAMRGSKYVQSRIGLVYREIEKLLQAGLPVLFSGTPCQVAGLYATLGQYYDQLFTLDLLCHGVPPQALLDAHLREIAGGKEIESISMRDKAFGWTATMHVKFTDGSQYLQSERNDAYLQAFHSNMSLRPCCHQCNFSTFPRQGDLSIGDFWWFETVKGGDKENRGTSLLLANNAKGHKLAEALRDGNGWFKKIETDVRKLPNRVHPKLSPSAERGRLFELLHSRSLGKAYEQCRNKQYDIGIVGPWENTNIGGCLTYYALYCAITDLGYSAQMIGIPCEAPWGRWDKRNQGFTDAPLYPDYAIAASYATRKDMRALNAHINQFVVGSDQIFNIELFNGWGKFTQLDWVDDSKKKLAYAASFGYERLGASESERTRMSYFLRKFDGFSVREKSAIELCRQELGIEAEHVLDPVFLCAQEHYIRLAKAAPIQNTPSERFIYGYLLSPASEIQNLAEVVSKEAGMPLRVYTHFVNRQNFRLEIIEDTLNARMRDMLDCQFVVTDSFHGLCFALLFRKNFLILPMFWAAYTRFESLLSDLNLEDRVVHSLADFEERKAELLAPIDYDTVYERLEPLVAKSRAWLAEQLQRPKIKPASDYDMATAMIEDLRQEFAGKLEQARQHFEAELRRVAHPQWAKLAAITDFGEYLAALRYLREDLVICIAARDTPANNLPENILAALGHLGLKINVNELFRRAYMAIIAGGANILEKTGKDKEIVNDGKKCGATEIRLCSAPFENGCRAEIKINGREHAVNSRGLNFVILAKNSGEVIDSVCFDTFLANAPAMRKGQ